MAFPSVKTKAKGGDFKPVPMGVHRAICIQLIDLGVQNVSFKGEAKRQAQVYLKFEIPSVRVQYEYEGQKVDRPAVVGRTFTNSIGKKSNLRPLLEAWRGKTFTEQEEKDFDLTNVVGKGCQISIIHKTKPDGGVFANINGIMGLSIEQQKELQANPKLKQSENELVVYTPAAHDPDVFSKLPEWIQEKIKARVQDDGMDQTPAKPAEDFDDDIPFN
ncbi:MAG: hypothetical protein JSR92_19750 [Proteobacteria bacterium]|nr:hypothetical protein [Pseudomonadota bacterium]MBS2011226.1 hypothetical protein [Cyanobacteria bacterium SZAS TMP-1]